MSLKQVVSMRHVSSNLQENTCILPPEMSIVNRLKISTRSPSPCNLVPRCQPNMDTMYCSSIKLINKTNAKKMKYEYFPIEKYLLNCLSC